MPRVSKNREIEQRKQETFFDDFVSAVTSLKDKKEVRIFFEDLLTTEEKLMLAKRFQVAMMLHSGLLWEEVDERVKVTQGTIANLHKRIFYGRGGLRQVAERIINLKSQKATQLEGKIRTKSTDLGIHLAEYGLGLLLSNRKRNKRKDSITK